MKRTTQTAHPVSNSPRWPGPSLSDVVLSILLPVFLATRKGEAGPCVADGRRGSRVRAGYQAGTNREPCEVPEAEENT